MLGKTRTASKVGEQPWTQEAAVTLSVTRGRNESGGGGGEGETAKRTEREQ